MENQKIGIAKLDGFLGEPLFHRRRLEGDSIAEYFVYIDPDDCNNLFVVKEKKLLGEVETLSAALTLIAQNFKN